MLRLALLLVPAVLAAGEPRHARLGEIEGRPEIQLHAAEPWRAGVRNAPLVDGAWIRTGAGARAEVELDEGSVFRLDAESLCEISDYARLSTGQRITLISLDRGVAYFTGEGGQGDSLVLALPGAQATIRRGARVRLEAAENWSRIAVIEGAVLFSSPSAELEITEGQMVRVDPANAARFHLFREVAVLESDAWSEARDRALVTSSATHVAAPPYGLADLDAAGAWIETQSRGTVWKPEVPAGWAPFRNGKWAWYEGLGYTWISAERWGWLPYHYGRWTLEEKIGWVWAPGADTVFSPGDVYWLRGAKLAGWGPLAPGEEWNGGARPQLYANAHTTFAPFAAEAREIDPAGFTPAKEALAAAAFTAALPSPALTAARLKAKRPVLRAGSTRVVPTLSGVTYGHGASGAPPAVVHTTTVVQPEPQLPVVIVTPPAEPQEIYYPVPVYTGIVVVDPPERGRPGRRRPPRPGQPDPVPEPQPQPAQPDPPKPEPARIERREPARERRERAPDPAPAPQPPPEEKAAETPVQRNVEPVRRAPSEGRRGVPR